MTKKSDVARYIGLHSLTIGRSVFGALMLLVLVWPLPYLSYGSQSWYGKLLSAPALIVEPLLSQRVLDSWRENAAEARGFLSRSGDQENDTSRKGRSAFAVPVVLWVAGLFLGTFAAMRISEAILTALYRWSVPRFVSEFRKLYLPFRSQFDSSSIDQTQDDAS